MNRMKQNKSRDAAGFPCSFLLEELIFFALLFIRAIHKEINLLSFSRNGDLKSHNNFHSCTNLPYVTNLSWVRGPS